jgi:hypothetical protein
MTVLIAVVAINLFIWVGLVCVARWQRGSDQMPAGDSDTAMGTVPPRPVVVK